MLRRASRHKYTAANANEEDGVEDLNLVVNDLEGGKEDALAVAAQVIPAAAGSLSEMEDDLTWTDNYFADRTDVVAVFDFNQDEYARSKNERDFFLFWISIAASFVLLFIMFVVPEAYTGVVILAIVYCYFGFTGVFAWHQQQIVWIPHLAVTATGVRYVEPPEKKSRFLGSTVHIPLEAVADIELNESASLGI